MPDLSLFELSELKEEEIKHILLEEYIILGSKNDTPEKDCIPWTADPGNISLFFRNIKTLFVKQVKTILYIRSFFPKSIRNNP